MLNHLMLKLSMKLTKEDGNLISPEKQVAPVCNVLHSAISEVKLYLQNIPVNDNSEMYPYR